ncbi:hypothetical protein D049_1121A, partial [Vibrio parahaemolyticus VPTS-2010]
MVKQARNNVHVEI